MARKPKVLPPQAWLEPRVNVARALSLLAFFGLVGLLCGYYLFVADLHGARPWVILLIELVPLLLLAPGMLLGSARGHSWMCFAVNLYFIKGALVGEVIEQQRVLGRNVLWAPAPPAALPYRCRPAHLKRALANLIDNAARYGRVQVTLAPSASPEPKLRIEITDQGPGIPADRIEQAFQPFARLEVARNGETGGFGLGLAIARSCVRAHGGELRLHNRAEGGLRAVIELPA